MSNPNMSTADRDRLIIFDTTLRDGEQSPGASMTRDEKVRIAKALERLKVDVIEAGFAIASVGDFESVKAVAEAVSESTVCSLARTSPGAAPPHPHLHCHLAHPHAAQAAHGAGCGH